MVNDLINHNVFNVGFTQGHERKISTKLLKMVTLSTISLVVEVLITNFECKFVGRDITSSLVDFSPTSRYNAA